jgi:deoxyribonuclease-4
MDEKLRFGTVGRPQTAPGTDTITAIAHIRDLGLHHLEIAWVRNVRISDEACAQIKAAAQAHDVSLSVHAPFYINLNSQTDELMRSSDKRLLAAARKGFLAGARDIVFHPGSYHGQPASQVYDRARAKLLELTGILRAEGVDVTLRPETMGKGSLLGSLDEVLRLSRDVPGVAPCIDWAHLHARTGDGSFNSRAEFATALDQVRAMLGDAALNNLHCHLSGIDYSAKGEKSHLPLNEADLHYRDLLQTLVDYDVGGVCAVEAPQPFHTADALTLQATYRRLLA